MANNWYGGKHDEDSDDKLLDEMGRVYRQGPPGGGKGGPPRRGGKADACMVVIAVGAGGIAAAAVGVSAAVRALI